MPEKCIHHPAHAAVITIAERDYCESCKRQQNSAALKVDDHIEPKRCFVTYKGSVEGWQPITGTGCAHWVSHQKGIHCGTENDQCLEGFTYRVKKVYEFVRVKIEHKDIKVGDIWINFAQNHMGIVSKVESDPKDPRHPAGGKRKITIQHDSSGQGKVAENDFDTYFGGHGWFYRL